MQYRRSPSTSPSSRQIGENAVEALFVENTMLIRHHRGARRESFDYRRSRQTLSFFFLPSFVFRLRNYIPRALSAARSSAIIAERSYSRADEHPALPYTYITRGVLRYIQQAYPTHFPFASRRSAVATSAPSNGKVGTCKLYVFMRPLCLRARD